MHNYRVTFNDQGTFEMVKEFIDDIEFANRIEIKIEKASEFIKDELIRKANEIFLFLREALPPFSFEKRKIFSLFI